MRTLWVRTKADGITAYAGIRDLDQDPLSDSLMEVLAGANTASVILEYKDGSKTRYQAIEYPCSGCGTYDHSDRACICGVCGNFWDDHTVDERNDRHCPWSELAP